MPQVDITGDYRSDAGQSRFPRLKLVAFEKARIFVAGQPTMEYVHRLEAPNIVNMAPVYKKIKGQDGSEQVVVDKRFVGGPLCQGSFEVLRERGVDDKNCQACLMARERPDIFRGPQPKYAANILKYGLRPGGGWNDIAAPYGVSALVWVFGGKVMDKLIDIRSMGEAYQDLRTVDLLLECDKDAVFQKPYSNGEFLPVNPAVWMSNDQTRSYTAQYLAANGAGPEDLVAAIGKKVKEDWLADDISRVIQRWEVVRAYESRSQGGPGMGPQGFGAETLQQGMGQLQQQYGGQGSQFAPNQQAATAPAGQFGGGLDMGLLGQAMGVPTGPAAPANFVNPLGSLDVPVPPPTPPTPTVTQTGPAAPAAPTASVLDVSTPASPPQGLDGLNEFMKNGAAAAQQAPPPPAPEAPAPQPPNGQAWTFDDLAKLA